MRKEYDPDHSDSDYDGTTGGRPGLYAGVTWTTPPLGVEAGLVGFDVALHTGTDPTDATTYVAHLRHIKDASAVDAALAIPSKKSGSATVHASVRMVFTFGPGPWATSGTSSTQTSGTVVVPGVSTVGTVSTTPSANALSIGGTGNHTITAHASGSTTEGILVAAAQDFPTGTKTFNSDLVLKSGGGYSITFSDGTSMSTAASGGITQLTSDVTAGPGSGSQAATIAANAVTTSKIATNAITNARLAQMAGNTIKSNLTGSSADPVDNTVSDVANALGLVTTGGTGTVPTQSDLVIFGSGTDGNLSSGAGTTTLTKDMFWNNVTLGSGDKIVTAGFRVFIAGTLDLSAADSGAIVVKTAANLAGGNGSSLIGGTGASGPNGSGCTLGGAHSQGLTGTNGGSGGSNGGAGSGATGTSLSGVLAGGIGGTGGNGGASTGGGGGGTGGSTSGSPPHYALYRLTPDLYQVSIGQSGATYTTIPVPGGASGNGGGGGGSDGSGHIGGGGGGGGAGNGVMYFAAKVIARGTNSNTGIISVKGGNGGNGAAGGAATNNGGGGGGAGGGGGWLVYVYRSRTGSTITNGIDLSGGDGGSGGNGTGTGAGGAGGGAGESALCTVYDLAAGTGTTTTRVAIVAGGAASGSTGGSGATNTQRVNI